MLRTRASRTIFWIAGMALALAPVVPAAAQDVVPPKVDVSTPAGVNLSDGYFQLNTTDLSIGSLSLERFTLPPSKLPVDDPYFGTGVTHNFDIYVAPTFIKAIGQPNPRPAHYHTVVHIGAGSSGVYYQSSPTSTTISTFNIDAQKGILALVSGAYVYTDSEGTIYTFNPGVHAGGGSSVYSQRIDNIVYADGRKQMFAYNGSGQLKMVSDNRGYAIVFDYNTDSNVSAACGFDLSRDYVTASSTCSGAAYKVSYAYTAALLTGVTDPLSQTTTYTHASGGYGYPITCVTPPGASACKVTNATDYYGKTTQQTLAGGAVWGIGFDTSCVPDPDFPETNGFCEVILTDPAGKDTLFDFTKSSPYRVVDPLARATSYHWMGSVLQDTVYDQTPSGPYLVEADFPEGDKYLAEYNGPFNLISKATRVAKPGTGLPDLVETWGYGPCYSPGTLQNCGKPIWKKDAKGNQADYAYASWGGLLSEMQPPPTAGAARPLKLYTYAQMSAYVKNSGGTLVSTGVPIWVISTMTQCQTVAGSSTAACDTAATAPRLQTTYQYPTGAVADNLLPRGTEVKDLVTGTTRLSCVTYDSIGRKISETSPRGNTSISVCP